MSLRSSVPATSRQRRHRQPGPTGSGAPIMTMVVLVALGTLTARRPRFGGLGGKTVVRCRAGHVFTTIWVPGVSVKAIRLGSRRLQRCPVGKHWSLVHPVRDADLTEADRTAAVANRDVRLP